ncbi:MAG: oxygen-independent coproporphyrinogen III oxidase [Caulobacteraceae bacterium]|nr:oxygen-independent coproporphyrinogen III oxidase [Caulobacteraceae bacterium]
MTLTCATARRLRHLSLLQRYGGRAPRYTSYPTAAQFTPAVDADLYATWLSALPVRKPVSVYVHIPFCARLCWYCGCSARAVHRPATVSDYVRLVTQEVGLAEARLPARLAVSAIHLGGGTPNMTSPEDLETLFAALRRAFAVAPGAEIAAEIDPTQLGEAWVRAAAGCGLTRASLGVQDLSPEVQAAVNRIEPFETVARAAALLRDAGVASLNLDLMYGLPKQRAHHLLATLERVLTLEPDRLALFGYAHVPWMRPHQKLIDEAALAGPAERLEQSEAAAERLTGAGYVRIGLDHYARPDDSLARALAAGRLRRNFQGYTDDQAQTLLGFGASAIGRLPQGYVQNFADELTWRKRIAAGELATARGLALTDEDRFRAEIIERLMCALSVDLEGVRRRHGRDASELAGARAALAGFEADGLVALDGPTVAVTELGRPFLRSVCALFDAGAGASGLRPSQVV